MVETTIIPFAQVTLNNCGQASKKGANMKTQYGARQSPFGVIPGSTAGRLSLGSTALHWGHFEWWYYGWHHTGTNRKSMAPRGLGRPVGSEEPWSFGCQGPWLVGSQGTWLAPRGLGWLSGTLVGSHGPWSAPRSRGYSPMVSWLLRALVGSQEPWLSGVWS